MPLDKKNGEVRARLQQCADQKITLLNLNARSILNKVQTLLLYEPDIVAITETWLSPSVYNHEIAPPNYVVVRKDRPSRGGGVALLIRRSILYTLLPPVPNAEAIFCKIICNGITVVAGCVY